jgi:hypothetical protein
MFFWTTIGDTRGDERRKLTEIIPNYCITCLVDGLHVAVSPFAVAVFGIETQSYLLGALLRWLLRVQRYGGGFPNQAVNSG